MLAAGETGEQDLKSRTLSPDNVCKVFHRPGNLELSNLRGTLTLVVSIAQREWHWGIQRGDRRRAHHPVQDSPPIRLPEAWWWCEHPGLSASQLLSAVFSFCPRAAEALWLSGDSKRHCHQNVCGPGLGPWQNIM